MKKNYLNDQYWQFIAEKTGYDFSGYSSESLNQKLEKFISYESIGSAADLKDRLSSDRIAQEKNLGELQLSYTEMFRDPEFFISLKKNVLPHLSIYPKIKIWLAGCSTGEEVYSLAILLDEMNLLNRCEIYATDINRFNLNIGESSIFTLQRMQESAIRYFRAGGKLSLSKYYTTYYDHVVFHAHLREHIKFIQHDVTEKNTFGKFHLILCRNVFTYFNYSLKKSVLRSLKESLYDYGYLGIGLNEVFVGFDDSEMIGIDEQNKILRKVL